MAFVRRHHWLTSAVAVLVVASGCAGATSGEPLVLTEDLGARLQATLDASVADEGLPGAQAAVVFPDGTVWSGAAGDANRQTGEDVTTETRFPIASITKLFTATAILRLAERGELSLDDTVTAWVPDEAVDRRVTVRQLLSHTSGLPGEAESTCEPGTCVNYSGVGYGLLGRVIEAVTGDTLAHAYRTEILDPIALTSTVLGTQEAVDGPLATGHDPEGPLEPADITVRRTFPSGEGNIGSSGAIVSTARDVAVFAAELFRGELLEAQTMSEMLDFETSLDLAGADECRAHGLGVLRESANTEFGLAWGHNGIVNGFTAAVRYYPGYDIAVAVLVNATGIGGGAQATEALLAGCCSTSSHRSTPTVAEDGACRMCTRSDPTAVASPTSRTTRVPSGPSPGHPTAADSCSRPRSTTTTISTSSTATASGLEQVTEHAGARWRGELVPRRCADRLRTRTFR